MNDLTILFYTSNQIPELFAKNVRNHLLQVTENKIPIISISQKPLDFGTNICVGDIGSSVYNVYKQVFIGAQQAKTKYVACCEDDSLYTPEHFTHRPEWNTFLYNMSRWRVYPGYYLYKQRKDATSAGMWNCIALTDMMVDTLGKRFEKYPVQGSMIGWGEPGRYEYRLGLEAVPAWSFRSEICNVTFVRRGSLGGVRRIGAADLTQESLPFWGDAKTLWEKTWNGKLV